MVAFVEADNKEKLLSFYENYGFKRFSVRNTKSKIGKEQMLIQMLKVL